MCEARQYSDQMQCGRCGLAWDVNDPEPPRCLPQGTAPIRMPARHELPAILRKFNQQRRGK